jgi:hypothetical protein
MQGQLFTQDFLTRGVTETPPWRELTQDRFAGFTQALRDIFGRLDSESTLNEAQTETEVIQKVLVALNWGEHSLPQVNQLPGAAKTYPTCCCLQTARPKQARYR